LEPHPLIKPLIRKYRLCKSCYIGCISKSRTHYSGDIKCDLLFIGDAPSDIDISLGEPFSDRAGKLLKTLVHEAGLDHLRIAYTNAIICTPAESDGGKIRKPKKSEITNCSNRLQEFINLAKPKLLIAVGAVADAALTKMELYHLSIIHPAAILRQEEQGDIDMARTMAVLKKIPKELKNAM